MKKESILTAMVLHDEHDMKEPNYIVKEIRNNLDTLQGIVGGYIEIPYISQELYNRGIDIVINEEGKLMGLIPTIYIVKDGKVVDTINGNAIFTSHDEEGNLSSLDQKQLDFLEQYIKESISIFYGQDGVSFAYVINI